MKKFFKGFYFALNGIRYTFNTQLNFRVHSFTGLIITGLGFYLELSTPEWLWIIGAMAIVLIAELANTAIEILVDLVSPEYNFKAGIIKDIAAAAVLIAAVMALITGILILLPRIIHAS
ncbi:MAG: diacylglycerol kinase family protein [Pedobacter sp.]|jgi:diacylglycerol kinase